MSGVLVMLAISNDRSRGFSYFAVPRFDGINNQGQSDLAYTYKRDGSIQVVTPVSTLTRTNFASYQSR